MNKIGLTIFSILLFTACSTDDSIAIDKRIPVVKAESTYTVLTEENITYSNGLGHNETSNTPVTIPLKLDVYYP